MLGRHSASKTDNKKMNMETKFRRDLEDYLAYNLYHASTNATEKAKLRKSLIYYVVLLVLFFGTIAYSINSDYHSLHIYIPFAVIVTILALLYPRYLRRHYKKSLSKQCKDTYKNNIGKEITLRINDDSIQTKSEDEEVTISISQLTEIGETGQYYFLKLLSGTAIIVPKDKLKNLDEFKITINEIAKKMNIEHKINLDWKWK